jgi:hypothetical protein
MSTLPHAERHDALFAFAPPDGHRCVRCEDMEATVCTLFSERRQERE